MSTLGIHGGGGGPSGSSGSGELTRAVVQATASGNTTLISAPGSGSALEVYRVQLSNSHATTALTAGVRFGASGTIFGKVYLPAAGGQGMINLIDMETLGGDNEAFIVNLSAGGQVECTAFYRTRTL
jgi:hypothetical protein